MHSPDRGLTLLSAATIVGLVAAIVVALNGEGDPLQRVPLIVALVLSLALGPLAAVLVRQRDSQRRVAVQQEEQLRALTLTDDLTGVHNRRGFLAVAEQQLKLARRNKRELVLLFVDMDDFKSINDRYGHPEGDAALRTAAQILRGTFRDSDVVARMGGDEFVVLAADTGSSQAIVDRLARSLDQHNAAATRPYRLSFSVGVARFDPAAPPSIEELLATADAMLYEQKRLRW
jgi:diguanylate cyclase (GGDEF)-like protein